MTNFMGSKHSCQFTPYNLCNTCNYTFVVKVKNDCFEKIISQYKEQ